VKSTASARIIFRVKYYVIIYRHRLLVTVNRSRSRHDAMCRVKIVHEVSGFSWSSIRHQDKKYNTPTHRRCGPKSKYFQDNDIRTPYSVHSLVIIRGLLSEPDDIIIILCALKPIILYLLLRHLLLAAFTTL